ncbi:MAG: helix-turn-helix transcriptional regulator [Asgard group archaeon]|nr:helix-turn-helix transcriptional regulator [Asgard group archaeon]
MAKQNNGKKEEEREILYSFWKDLPLLSVIEVTEKELFSHEVRYMILAILRKGIGEKSKKEEEIRKRHALTAREILELVNNDLEPKMKLQAMYFHLQKLQNAGIIKVVATLHEGRHNIAYFGRVAKNFFFEDRKKEQEKYENMLRETGKLAQKLNPKVSIDIFDRYIEKIIELHQERYKRVNEWLNTYEKEINIEEIDLTQVLSFLSRLTYADSGLTELYREIAKLVEFEIR